MRQVDLIPWDHPGWSYRLALQRCLPLRTALLARSLHVVNSKLPNGPWPPRWGYCRDQGSQVAGPRTKGWWGWYQSSRVMVFFTKILKGEMVCQHHLRLWNFHKFPLQKKKATKTPYLKKHNHNKKQLPFWKNNVFCRWWIANVSCWWQRIRKMWWRNWNPRLGESEQMEFLKNPISGTRFFFGDYFWGIFFLLFVGDVFFGEYFV